MSLGAFRRSASRSICLLCRRPRLMVDNSSIRFFAARTRPAAAGRADSAETAAAEHRLSSIPSTAGTRPGTRPREAVAATEAQPLAVQPVPILHLLLPQREEEHRTGTLHTSQQPSSSDQESDSMEAEATTTQSLQAAAPALAETAAADVTSQTSILDLLRPQLVDDPPPSNSSASSPHSTTLASSIANAALDTLPAGSLHDPDAASDELLSADATITDADYDRFMTEPLKAAPTFEEMERQVDSLLRLEVRGRRMFPLYMRDQLKLATLTHMRDVIAQLFPQLDSSSPPAAAVTQHTLHSRLFTFLIKRGSKLAHTLDERITILCPEAPAVGEKVPHPQWPELTTVVRRGFAVSRGGEFGIELEDEERVLRRGKVKMRELFSGLGLGGEGGPAMQDGDALVDLDSLNVDEMRFREETEEIPRPGEGASDTQRLMYESQVEARHNAVAFLKERIRQLQKQRERLLKEGRAAERGEAEEDAKTREGGTHVLSVVYRFDGEGEEFEVRYPLSKRDVERMQLFDEADDADTVITMSVTTPE